MKFDCLMVLVVNILVLFEVGTSHLDCSTCSGDATCLLNHSCSTDHSMDTQLSDCSKMSRSTGRATTSTNTDTIYECQPNKHCHPRMSLNDSFYLKVKYVRWQERPVNASHFFLDVFWDWFRDDLEDVASFLEGYELRISKDSRLIKCLCIEKLNRLNLSLGVLDDFEYDSATNSNLLIDLSTFPVDSNWESSRYTQTNTASWPKQCSNSEVCLPQLPNAPSLRTNYSMKQLKVSWTPTSPENVYYVELDSTFSNKTLTVLVNGSNCITFSGLPVIDSWSVRVQGYTQCSGLASYYSGNNNSIGCGPWSGYSSPPITTPTTLFTSFTPSPHLSSTNFSLIISSVVGFIFVAIVVAAAAVILIYIRKINHTHNTTSFEDEERQVITMNIYQKKPAKVEALVLYSLSTPTHEKIEIEKYVVGLLKHQNFKVISCNDHTEKTIVQWVEENARLAHAVFIICNKQFGLDWKMNTRPQLVNSLEMIVASAVGQNRIKKYATILLRPEDEKYIPDNLYFKGMKSFVISSRASHDEKAKLASFVKLNSAIPC